MAQCGEQLFLGKKGQLMKKYGFIGAVPASAEEWSEIFIQLTSEQMLQRINNLSDSLRTLRREVVATMQANQRISRSTRNYGVGWQDSLGQDISGISGHQTINPGGEDYGQTPNLRDTAEDFWTLVGNVGSN